jgi:hypothetical protein
VQLRAFGLLIALAIGVASCSQEQTAEYTDQQRSCIADRHTNYDPKKLNQCVDVCRICMRGNVVTCTTSCKLRGAS